MAYIQSSAGHEKFILLAAKRALDQMKLFFLFVWWMHFSRFSFHCAAAIILHRRDSRIIIFIRCHCVCVFVAPECSVENNCAVLNYTTLSGRCFKQTAVFISTCAPR